MASTINATPTSSGLISTADNSGVLALQTGGTTAVTVDGSQNVGIGTSSPSQKLQVKGFSALEQLSGGANNWLAYHYTDNTYRLNYNGSGSDEFILYTNGNYAFLGSNVSDMRLKQDIELETSQIDNILALTPKTYKFKPRKNQDGSLGQTSGLKHGFIAQEVLQVIPELISGDPTNEDEILGVDYNGIVAICVKAIQELNAKVDAQATTIAELQARNT